MVMGGSTGKKLRLAMQRSFKGDVKRLVGLRCLVLIDARDEEGLGVWSRETVGGNVILSIKSQWCKLQISSLDTLFELVKHAENRASWLCSFVRYHYCCYGRYAKIQREFNLVATQDRRYASVRLKLSIMIGADARHVLE